MEKRRLREALVSVSILITGQEQFQFFTPSPIWQTTLGQIHVHADDEPWKLEAHPERTGSHVQKSVMSSAYGKVFKDGKLCGHFRYSGTASRATTQIHPSREEVWRNWEGDNVRRCTCSQPSEAVILSTDYGAGLSWNSQACFLCMAITGPLDGGPELMFSGLEGDEIRYTEREGPFEPGTSK